MTACRAATRPRPRRAERPLVEQRPDLQQSAQAKINLDLHVIGRRPDGRHDLDSIVAFARYGDELRFAPADDFALTIEGPFADGLEADADNLVARAARALAEHLGRPLAVRIRLVKRLPVASGVGGGSADAAATLRGLQAFWQVGDVPGLAALAAGLGADVPVCLASAPRHMQDVGDRLAPLDLPAEGLPVLLVNPGVAVPTGDVFRGRRPHEAGPRLNRLPPPPAPADFVRWLAEGRNDLQPAAIRIAPVIDEVLGEMRGLPGCALARMSGSGATCFGLFPTRRAAAAAAMRLSTRRPDWWVQASELAAA